MTKRETLIQNLLAMFRAMPAFPAKVERSLIRAYTREESPVLVIHRGTETANYETYGVVDRTCEIMVSILIHSQNPEQDADEIMEIVHPAMMGYTNDPNVQILDVTEGMAETPVFAREDRSAVMLTTRYQFKYRTQPNTL